jgi:2C-methyl-D-erythritol 2,4-cyclodiphosphate synthase
MPRSLLRFLWPFQVFFFLVSLFVQDFSGLLGGVVVFTVLDAILEVLKVMEDIGMVLKDTSVSLVGKLSTVRLKQYFTTLG